MNNLKLKNIKHAVKLFQNWTLDNLNDIFHDNYLVKFGNILILYGDVLEIFLKYPYFYNAKEVKKMILLLDKDKRWYSKFLNCSFKHKNIIEKHFLSFIEETLKNKIELNEKK